MDTQNTKLQHTIMRQVRRVYYLRLLGSPLLQKVYFLAAVFAAVASLVSVGDVFANIPEGSLATVGEFVWTALINAELVVQLLTVSMAVTFVFLLRDVVRRGSTPTFAN